MVRLRGCGLSQGASGGWRGFEDNGELGFERVKMRVEGKVWGKRSLLFITASW